MHEELMWFDNPPRRRSKTRRKPPKGFKSWSAWSAAMRRRKSKGGAKMARKRRRTSAKSTPRRRRRSTVAAAPRRRRRSHHRITSRRAASRAGRILRYRRPNPPNFFSNLPGRLMEAGIGAVEVTLGKAGALAIPKMVKKDMDMTSAMGLATQVVSALAIGWLGSMVSPNAGKMLLIGGLTAPIESFVKGAKIPVISEALSGQDYFAVGSYPAPVPALHGYVQAPALAAYEDDFSAYPQ